MRPRLLALATAVGLLAPLVQHTPVAAQSNGQRGDRADWTFMVYDVADTSNIEQDLIVDIDRLAEVGSSDNMNIVALVDRAPGQFDGPMVDIPDFESTKLVKVEKDHAEEIQDYGEVDMASPQTLSWFVYTMMKQYPAEHYALTIDDHGGSFSGVGWDDSTPPDADGFDANLRIPEVASALKAAIDEAGEDRIDVLNYAACLLAEYDAASSLAGSVDYLIASEETTIGEQADMRTMVQSLQQDPEDLQSAIRLFFAETTELYEVLPNLTMSVIDVDRMATVDAALDSFAAAVTDDIDEAAGPLARALSRTAHFGVEDSGEDFFQSYDIGDLLSHMDSVSAAVDTARNALYEAATNAVLLETHGPAAAGATGMSIYFPVTGDQYERDYYGDVAASSAWLQMLDAYYDTDPSAETDGDQGFEGGALSFVTDVDLQASADGILATADLDPSTSSSAATAEAMWGATLNDGSVAYLLRNPGYLDSGQVGTVAGTWDLVYLEMSDGDGQASLLTTSLLTPVQGGLMVAVPVIFQTADGTQARGEVSFFLGDDGSTTPPTITVTDADSGATAGVTPDRGDIVAPLVLTESTGGDLAYELLSDQAVDATSLTLSPTSLASGSTVVAKLVAETGGGDAAVAAGTVQIP